MGAAFLAGLAVGYWSDLDEIQQIWQTDTRFSPTQERKNIEEGIEGWHRAIKALQFWAK